MTKQMVKLDKKEIIEAIEAGDNCQGRRWMAVSPDGDCTIHWADTNRQWDPWQDDDFVIGLPALFPEGEGKEWEMCEDIAIQLGLNVRELEKEIELGTAYDGLVDFILREHPDYYQAHKEELLDYEAGEFLHACEGRADNDPYPWGTTGSEWDGSLEAIQPPFEFEWK